MPRKPHKTKIRVTFSSDSRPGSSNVAEAMAGNEVTDKNARVSDQAPLTENEIVDNSGRQSNVEIEEKFEDEILRNEAKVIVQTAIDDAIAKANLRNTGLN